MLKVLEKNTALLLHYFRFLSVSLLILEHEDLIYFASSSPQWGNRERFPRAIYLNFHRKIGSINGISRPYLERDRRFQLRTGHIPYQLVSTPTVLPPPWGTIVLPIEIHMVAICSKSLRQPPIAMMSNLITNPSTSINITQDVFNNQ